MALFTPVFPLVLGTKDSHAVPELADPLCQQNSLRPASSSGASFFARKRRATGDEPQGTMGRVQTVGSPVVSFPPSFARAIETSGYEAGLRQSSLNCGETCGDKVNTKKFHFADK